MKETRIKTLQRMPIFGGLSEETLNFLVDQASVVTREKGEYFFHEKDTAVSMYILEEGAVGVCRQWHGEEYLLRRLGRGDCFGEMVLMDYNPRSASVVALDHCEAMEITAATLYKLHKNNLQQFVIIQMNMGREVSRRLRYADDKLFEARVEARIIDGKIVALKEFTN